MSVELYPQVLARRAADMPDRDFIQDVAGPSMTFGQFHNEALRWADAYRRAGVRPEARVVVMMPTSMDFFVSSLALAWLRAVEVPVNIDYRGPILRHAIAIAQPETVVCHPVFVERFAEIASEVSGVRRLIVLGDDAGAAAPWPATARTEFLADASPAADAEGPNPWDVASVVFTSGTTGPSKGVILPWGHVHRGASTFMPMEDAGAADAFYGCLMATYHVGARLIPYWAALIGGRLVFRERFSPSEFWTDVNAFGCTTTVMVGAMVPMIFGQNAPRDTTLRNLILAPAPPNVDELKERFGFRVGATYAMTEVPNPIGSAGWTVTNANHSSCGVARPGFDLRIVDEHDREQPDSEVGELIVRTDEPWTMNVGYLGMPEATVEAWRNGWFHTGDAFRRVEGNFYFVDRVKDCIRRRGENISTFEVEGLVNAHPEVAESAAIPVPSELGEDEVMVLAVRTPHAELTYDRLIVHCIETMPRFMVPRYIEFVDELPKTPTARVKKKDLRERGVTAGTWDREAAGISVPR